MAVAEGETRTFYEERAYGAGWEVVVGIDEAGRGALAGPVVAAACSLPRGFYWEEIRDSKKLTPAQRERIFDHLQHHPAITFSLGVGEVNDIDEKNILRATLEAMARAAAGCWGGGGTFFLVDGPHLPVGLQGEAIVDGDHLSQVIGAASIIAKCQRDRIMEGLHEHYPHYGWNRNKGYGTAEHCEALRRYGPVRGVHRFTFHPVKSFL